MSEEINLTTLFKNVARAIKTHFLFVVTLFVIGCSLSFIGIKFMLPVKYSSQCLLKSSYLDAKTIEISLDHLNAVLASKQLETNYKPFEGCIDFTVKDERESTTDDQFLTQKNSYITILVNTKNEEKISQLAGAIKQYFDTNSTYISIRDTKHQVLMKMISDLDKRNENISNALAFAAKDERSNLLMLPNTPTQIAMAETVLSTKEIVNIVQDFSPAKEIGKKALISSILIGLGFIGLGFIAKAFIEA